MNSNTTNSEDDEDDFDRMNDVGNEHENENIIEKESEGCDKGGIIIYDDDDDSDEGEENGIQFLTETKENQDAMEIDDGDTAGNQKIVTAPAQMDSLDTSSMCECVA